MKIKRIIFEGGALCSPVDGVHIDVTALLPTIGRDRKLVALLNGGENGGNRAFFRSAMTIFFSEIVSGHELTDRLIAGSLDGTPPSQALFVASSVKSVEVVRSSGVTVIGNPRGIPTENEKSEVVKWFDAGARYVVRDFYNLSQTIYTLGNLP